MGDMVRIFTKSIILLSIASTACSSINDSDNKTHVEATGTIHAALTQCGLSCPAGFHPSSESCNGSCGTCSFNAPNFTQCDTNGSVFTQCGTICPSGYYANSESCSGNCGTSCSSTS